MPAPAPLPAVVSTAIAALPPCWSYSLDQCLNADNVDGLPDGQCATIIAAYESGPENERMINDAVVALPICKPPNPWHYAAVGWGAGALFGYLLCRLR